MEPLKNQFGLDVPRALAAALGKVYAPFPEKAFLAEVTDGFDQLELMARARRIAGALGRHLPPDYPKALQILMSSLGPRADPEKGMSSFRFLPHIFFIADRGLGHLDASLEAQKELTQRFTAEFSIRAFLDKYPKETLARFREWARHESPHVRRLVSEGSRPRLPWAGRLRQFQKDPRPTLALLEMLKDDPSLYVRKSVANHLNDIGKDHPNLLLATARAWLRNAGPERRWIVRYGLRTLVKECHPEALALLGYRGGKVRVKGSVSPSRPARGGEVKVRAQLKNLDRRQGRFLVDFRIHYVKAGGATRAKVFKLKGASLAPGASTVMEKKVRLKEMTTRKHFPGRHAVELLVNGRAYPAGAFWIA